MIDLSIIIVNYNSSQLLATCVKSIHSVLGESVNYELIVVDNNSSDNSLGNIEISKNLTVLRQDKNLGFAKANNLGFAHSKGRIVHFLNPDTRLSEGMQVDYARVLASSEKCLYYNRLIDDNGSVAKIGQMVYTLDNYFRKVFNPSRVALWNTGASVIMYRSTFIDIGRWDERYFMYSEDMDLFYSAWLKGYEVKYLESTIYHHSGGCSENVWSNKERQKKVDYSLNLFLRKYNKGWQYLLIKALHYINQKRNIK